MEGFFAVNTVRLSEYSENIVYEQKIAEQLYRNIKLARQISDSQNPEKSYRYRNLLQKTELLISYFSKMHSASEDFIDEVNYISRKFSEELEDNTITVKNNMKLF